MICRRWPDLPHFYRRSLPHMVIVRQPGISKRRTYVYHFRLLAEIAQALALVYAPYEGVVARSWNSRLYPIRAQLIVQLCRQGRATALPFIFCVLLAVGTGPLFQRWFTYSMVQRPSWEANWFAASQEIPRISRNPKVHYRTHKRPPPVSILGQPNPVHIPTSHLLEIRPNIIHPSTPRSPQRSLSLRFPHQDPIRPPLLPHTRHMPCPSHSSWFYHPHNIGWGVQIT